MAPVKIQLISKSVQSHKIDIAYLRYDIEFGHMVQQQSNKANLYCIYTKSKELVLESSVLKMDVPAKKLSAVIPAHKAAAQNTRTNGLGVSFARI